MTNFRHEESMAPAGDEAIGAIANDVAWTRVEHPALLRAGKRAVDIAAALFFFCAFGWLYVLIALGVFITSGAPVLYSQPRFGRGGRVFKFYKFRSMLRNSAEILEEHLRNDPVARQQWDDYQKLENDPRITR
ncbi:MAG: sugar transferase, partial [Burkholderiales bacterium]|nr:sugar transferase [Burkholderiales bacterium]